MVHETERSPEWTRNVVDACVNVALLLTRGFDAETRQKVTAQIIERAEELRVWLDEYGVRSSVAEPPASAEEAPELPPAPPTMRAWCDGAAQPNPGHAGWGVHAVIDDTAININGYIGIATNNVAEWQALIEALKLAKSKGVRRVEIFADSNLVVQQFNGRWKCDHEGLLPLRAQAWELRDGFESVTLQHVPRGQNQTADILSKQALAKR